MNPASADVAAMLEGAGAALSVTLVLATNLFVGREPSDPSTCVTVFDTPGRAPLLTLAGDLGPNYHFPSIQIRVRDKAYLDGWNLIGSIRDYLHGLHGVNQGGSLYDVIRCSQDPSFLEWDERGRCSFVVTFDIARNWP